MKFNSSFLVYYLNEAKPSLLFQWTFAKLYSEVYLEHKYYILEGQTSLKVKKL